MEHREKPPKNLPLGTGGEMVRERERLTREALEVRNSVIYVNPAFRGTMPFDLQLGKPTKLGMFFTPKPETYPGETPKRLMLLPEYISTRSGQFGSVVFRDKSGRFYRDVDAKGIGIVRYQNDFRGHTTRVGEVRIESPNESKALGLCDYSYAERDRLMSERFLKAGIRTHAVLGVALLEEIIDREGVRISIEEARKQYLIPSDMQPVIVFRAFGTKERLASFEEGPEDRKVAALEDAKAFIAQELRRDPKTFSTHDYLKWFAKTLGQQVAKIRKLKMHHGYLTSHNITLDCRIVDLDSVDLVKNELLEEGSEHESEEQFYEADFSGGGVEVSNMARGVHAITNDRNTLTEDKYTAFYERAYKDELQGAKQKKGQRARGAS